MVEATVKVSLRGQRRRERLEKLKAARPAKAQSGVRVVPVDDKYRKLKHPNGMAFRSEGSVEWPNDRFTKRRIAEGVVRVEEQNHKEERGKAKPAARKPEPTEPA